jgi:hypothetical protein
MRQCRWWGASFADSGGWVVRTDIRTVVGLGICRVVVAWEGEVSFEGRVGWIEDGREEEGWWWSGVKVEGSCVVGVVVAVVVLAWGLRLLLPRQRVAAVVFVCCDSSQF